MNNIRILRELRGIKQRALAIDLGVTQAAVSGWETGEKSPSLDTAIKIAQYFHVSVGCVAGSEPVPEEYQSAPDLPVEYEETIRKQRAPLESLKQSEHNSTPFSKDQLEYLDQWGNELAGKVVDALKEDTYLLREKNHG